MVLLHHDGKKTFNKNATNPTRCLETPNPYNPVGSFPGKKSGKTKMNRYLLIVTKSSIPPERHRKYYLVLVYAVVFSRGYLMLAGRPSVGSKKQGEGKILQYTCRNISSSL